MSSAFVAVALFAVLLGATATATPPDEEVFSSLAAADDADLRGAVHEASRLRDGIRLRCDDWETASFTALPEATRARAAGVCALVYAQAMGVAPAWRRFALARRLKGTALALDTNPLSPTDRLYFEGRIFSELPPEAGLDFRRALVAWASLQRLQPESAAADYGLARTYERQRNYVAARDAYAAAAARTSPDARAQRWRDTTGTRARQRLFDGWRSGFEPALFFTPMRGLGLFGRIYDERLGDRDRAVEAAAWAATRGVFGVRASAEEATWVAPVRLGASVLGVLGPEDFFGLGIGSASSAHTRVQGFRADARVTASQEFLDHFQLTVGWRAMSFSPRTFTPVDGTVPAMPPDTDGSLFTGALGELSFDTRDSRYDPRRGTYAAVGGFFPAADFGSSRTFTLWHLTAQQYVPLGWRQFLLVQALAQAVEGNAPFAAYPKLPPVGGVRELRYQDRFSLVVNAEFQRRLVGPVSLIAFVSAGTVAPSGGSAFRVPWRAGGGGGAVLALDRSGRSRLRFELGTFGPDFIARLSMGLFF